MKNLLEYFDNILSENLDEINDKLLSTNYLEKLKYIIINNLKNQNLTEMNKSQNDLMQKKYGQNDLLIKIENYQESISKIKCSNVNDDLCIVLKGSKSIKIYEQIDSNKSKHINLYQFMGICLPKDTIKSESISAGTIFLL